MLPQRLWERFTYYIENRAACLAELVREDGVSVARAKKLFQIAIGYDYEGSGMMGSNNAFFRAFQQTCSELQSALLQASALQGLAAVCTGSNRGGKLISRAWMYVEARVTTAVRTAFTSPGPDSLTALTDGGSNSVGAILHDALLIGKTIVDGELCSITDDAAKTAAVCSAASRIGASIPGFENLNLIWAFKEHDFTIRHKRTGEVLCTVERPAGSIGVPESLKHEVPFPRPPPGRPPTHLPRNTQHAHTPRALGCSQTPSLPLSNAHRPTTTSSFFLSSGATWSRSPRASSRSATLTS